MSDSHEHKHSSSPPDNHPLEDAGTQALAEALSSSFKLVKVIMILLVIVFFGSGIREVGSYERAIKLQFGKPVGTGDNALLGSGWHWAWPYPINEIVTIPIGQVQEVTSSIGWYGRTREQQLAGIEPPVRATLNPVVDGYLMTGDGNIMHSQATLRYRITDAVRYAFDFNNASNQVRNVVNNALDFAAARFTVDDAYRKEVTAFKDAVHRRIDQLLIAENIPVSVENLEINSIPPRQVKDAFDAVLGAEAMQSKTINDADGEASRIKAIAEGTAAGIIDGAHVDASRLTNSVAADARYFQDQLRYFRENRDLYVNRLQAEYLGRIMTNVNMKIVQVQAGTANRHEMRLLLNREPEATGGNQP